MRAFPKWLRIFQAFVFFLNAFNFCLQLSADTPKVGYAIAACLQMLAFGLVSSLNIHEQLHLGND